MAKKRKFKDSSTWSRWGNLRQTVPAPRTGVTTLTEEKLLRKKLWVDARNHECGTDIRQTPSDSVRLLLTHDQSSSLSPGSCLHFPGRPACLKEAEWEHKAWLLHDKMWKLYLNLCFCSFSLCPWEEEVNEEENSLSRFEGMWSHLANFLLMWHTVTHQGEREMLSALVLKSKEPQERQHVKAYLVFPSHTHCCVTGHFHSLAELDGSLLLQWFLSPLLKKVWWDGVGWRGCDWGLQRKENVFSCCSNKVISSLCFI